MAERDGTGQAEPLLTLEPSVLVALVLTLVGLAGQLVLVDYPDGTGWVRWLWFAAGLVLLWGVARWHSHVARWVLVVWGALGLFSFATATIAGDPTLLRGLALVASFGVQLVAMLRPAVGAHCRTGPGV